MVYSYPNRIMPLEAPPASILLTRNVEETISQTICKALGEFGLPGFASHAALSIGYGRIIESTLWRVKISPITKYIGYPYETIIIDIPDLPKKYRDAIVARAVTKYGKLYPFWELGFFFCDTLSTRILRGVGIMDDNQQVTLFTTRLIWKLVVCSQFVAWSYRGMPGGDLLRWGDERVKWNHVTPDHLWETGLNNPNWEVLFALHSALQVNPAAFSDLGR